MRIKKQLYLVLCLALIFLMTACNTNTPANKGVKNITLVVVHGDATETSISIGTEKETLQEALEEEKIISGESSSTGMFVKTVDGETVDDSKQQWWCLTKKGEMWNYGVNDTKIEDGDQYEFTLTTGY